ncbi:MAG: DUF308 domain-containing protein [Actinomycetota bacterium]|nr:DUF308 domain-containing protein [Actinomycetota bacterium]
MAPNEYSAEPAPSWVLVGSWLGIGWIVQGVGATIGGFADGGRDGRGWWIAFGAVSLIAGIVVTAAPMSSLSALAALLGIWFPVMVLFHIVGAFLIRRASRTTETTTRTAEMV